MVACESRLGVLEERGSDPWCDVELYSKIPFELNAGVLAGKLRVDRGSSDFRELMEMVDLAVRMGKPKAAYAEFYAESAADHG